MFDKPFTVDEKRCDEADRCFYCGQRYLILYKLFEVATRLYWFGHLNKKTANFASLLCKSKIVFFCMNSILVNFSLSFWWML